MLNQLARRRARSAARPIERAGEVARPGRSRPLWLDFAIAGCAALAITAGLVALTTGQRRERERLAQIQEARERRTAALQQAVVPPPQPAAADPKPPAPARPAPAAASPPPAPVAPQRAAAPPPPPAAIPPVASLTPGSGPTPPLVATTPATTSAAPRVASLGATLPLRQGEEQVAPEPPTAFAPRDTSPAADQAGPTKGEAEAAGSAPVPPPRPLARLGDQVASGAVGDGASTECLPPGLRTVLADVGKRFGSVTILATNQKQTSNHGRGTTRSNLHFSCRAVDFRPADGRMNEVLNYVRVRPEVNGYNAYRNGVIHIDAAPDGRSARGR